MTRVFRVSVIVVLTGFGLDSHAAGSDWDGKVIFMRHALAPGNGDPEHFDLGNCMTQRNLDERGRQQAKRLGEALKERQIVFSKIYSSEWCRCQETAELLEMGEVTTLRSLNSFYEHHFSRDELLPVLQQRLSRVKTDEAPILMVTHFVTITAVTHRAVSSGSLVIYDPVTRESVLANF